MADALHQRNAGIRGRDDRPELTTTSSRITLRVNVSYIFATPLYVSFTNSSSQWAGYKEYPVAVNAREHSTAAASIPTWKLAYCIAHGVNEFYRVGNTHFFAKLPNTNLSSHRTQFPKVLMRTGATGAFRIFLSRDYWLQGCSMCRKARGSQSLSIEPIRQT